MTIVEVDWNIMFSNKLKEKQFYTKGRKGITWRTAGLFESDETLWLLDDLLKKIGIENQIKAVYGCVTTPWGGGRMPQLDDIGEKELAKIIEKYNSRGIACYFTFSNYHADESFFDDKMGNLLCSVASNISDLNGIIVSSDALADYIKEKYPKLKQISSIIKPVYQRNNYDDTPEYYNKLCERYDLVVVRPEFYRDLNFMKKLKYKSQIELLVNLYCFSHCPLSQMHYDKTVKHSPDDTEAFQRSRFCNKKINNILNYPESLAISNENIDQLIKIGFKHFKLAGRGISSRLLLARDISRYIFDPTGHFQHVEQYISQKIHAST